MEVAGMKAQRQTWSEADMYELKNAVKRAQGTDDAGVNWASVSMELGRCMYSTREKEVEEDEAGQWQGRRRVSPSPVFPAAPLPEEQVPKTR